MLKRCLGWLSLVVSGVMVWGCVGAPTESGPVVDDEGDAPAEEAQVATPTKVGDVRSYSIDTPHPYKGSWSHEVSSPGAEFVRVHFKNFHLGEGDVVTVASPDGAQSYTYTGRGPHDDGDVWAFAIDGDRAIVTLTKAEKGGGHGFTIDAVGHGTVSLQSAKAKSASGLEEVVCGTDGREDIACYPALDALQKPVARLLFTSGASQYLCTGWLVAGSNANSMLTNNHCFSTQTELNTLEARFNYQYTSCGGSTLAATTSYGGGTLLKTNTSNRQGKKGGLDYTLVTLQGNPEATFGELIATTKQAVVGENIYFIQHPAGRPKEIGYWEDDAHTIRCAVATINMTYSQAATGSQTGYGCDSEGGSSGSPIIDAVTNHAIALHHFGGVSNSPCLNSGTEMSAICADAGALLSCVAN